MAQTIADTAPPAATSPIARVTVDLAARAFNRVLPFDVPFFITGQAPEGTQSLEVQYAVVPKSGDTSNLLWPPSEPARCQPVSPSAADQPFLILIRAPLEAGRTYRMRFVFRDGRSVETTTTADGRTHQKNYVSLDTGVLYAGDLGIGAL